MGDTANGAPLKRVESYQWPSGHVAHLTEGQLGALAKFKQLCQDKGYFSPGDDKTAPSHDDETLLRYLRARKFLPQEAFTQFKDTEDWRKENQLDKLYETIDINEYDQSRRLYPQWTGRRDKRGIPLYVYEIASVDPKAVSVYTNSKDSRKQSTNTKVPWKMLKLFALYENLCRFVLPLCSAIPDREHSETPISQSNNIVDLSGVGFTKLFNLRNHMSDASQLATAHYPETLDRIFVIGAPGYFDTVWGWAKRWFDPITVAKIFILPPKTMTATLAKFIDIDDIPKKYGGNLDWKFGDMPILEPAIANTLRWREDFEHNGHKTLPIGPIKLQYDEHGDLLVTAIGTENGKARQRVIAGLHPEDGVARLALSAGRIEPTPKAAAAAAAVQNSISPTATILAPKATTNLQNGTPSTPTLATAPVPASETTPAASSTPIANGVAMSSTENSNNTGTYLSYQPSTDASNAHNSTPSDATTNAVTSPPPVDGNTSREGTSETRYQQQTGTHAEGTLANGTPDVRVDSQGEKQALMDPHTVGQAPKEHPLPIPEEPAPSIVDQAKEYAGQAVEQAKALPATVMSAVGMGGHKEEAVEQETKKEDPAIDSMPGQNVEEFLRSQTMSKPESSGQT